jgi:hydrophobic/amphiphilic exporter-1 (mainly G- bacteria), HAE1 family
VVLVYFVRRPVFAAVISILLTSLGAIALQRMPMRLFPSIAPPEVNVTVEYPGANAQVVAKAALEPLERAINGVPGMKYMTSDAGSDGIGIIQILFEPGTNPDVAAINVQTRVNDAMGLLPAEVRRNGVAIAKEENAILMYLSLHSSNPEHDQKFLYNFADLNLLSELKRVPGIGYADVVGAKEYAMRVWLKPDKLAAYQVSTDEVLEALRAHNLEAAPGKIGENSDKGTTPLQYTVTYTGSLSTPEQYLSVPIRATADGQLLRIEDVADVELGTAFFDVEAKFNGRPAASIVLKQLPGSNAREVIAAVKQQLAQIERETFLPGMSYDVSFDVSRFLDASVREVVKTLVEAFVLVGLVVFLFLQDRRATILPILAVPVSLIGCLAFIEAIGFSLNLITLFALVLAIGIVVDNAIVVVEAIHHKIHHDELSPREAAERALGEVGPAIIAMTFAMTAVFIPLGFVGGPAGVFYRQFGVVMAVSIALSGFVALTLIPSLCARFLRRHDSLAATTVAGRIADRFFARFNRGYARVERSFVSLARVTATKRVIAWVLTAGFLAGGLLLARQVPRGFIPNDDQGVFYVNVTSPPGATLERTKDVVDAIAAAGRGLEGVESIATLAGTNVLSDGTGASYGTCVVNLRPWHERRHSVAEVIAELKRRTAHVQGADLEFFPPPAIPGYGNASGFELRLLDKTGRVEPVEMERVAKQFVTDLQQRPEIASAFTIFNAGYPQYTIRIDVDRAAQLGVTPERALATLETLIGSEYASNFIRWGRMYKVMVQALPEYRATPDQLLKLEVRSERGELVPMASFIALEKSYGVDQVTRYNMYPSAEINGDGAPGYSSGQVLDAVQQTAQQTLPRGYGIDWAGISRDEVSAGNQGVVVGLIALLFVFLVLAAQYESFVLPIAVLLSLPAGLFGGFLLLHCAGLENNIYTHVALVVLIGLLGKNAILIVEYAERKCEQGRMPIEAVVEAARLRLRPILMTSLAFVAGLIPLALASGAGAVANRTIGTATIGGMVMGTVWGTLVVPGLYMACKRLSQRFSPVQEPVASVDVSPRKLEHEEPK